jgi:hypothetical protein
MEKFAIEEILASVPGPARKVKYTASTGELQEMAQAEHVAKTHENKRGAA